MRLEIDRQAIGARPAQAGRVEAEPKLRLSAGARELLRCPACRARLELAGGALRCRGAICGAVYPIVDGVPVLVDEAASLFSIADFVQQRATYFKRESRLQLAVKGLMPKISRNVRAGANYARLAALLLERSAAPRVLVLGGSVLGSGMEALLAHPSIELVESDVALGPRTALIADAHAIPFDDGAFDGVIAQAVIPALVDPARAVDEIHRVLAAGGLVYAKSAFMQQVYGGRYDYTRYTHLGHRRLFRRFEEVDSGVVCGPGMGLAWSYQHFLLSFTESQPLRKLLRAVARLTAFPLKYFDGYLAGKAGALDAASAVYFIGRRSDRRLDDRELIKLYRGLS